MMRIASLASILALVVAAADGKILYETKCAQCHNSAPVTGDRQFFTDKRVRTVQEGFDPGSAASPRKV